LPPVTRTIGAGPVHLEALRARIGITSPTRQGTGAARSSRPSVRPATACMAAVLAGLLPGDRTVQKSLKTRVVRNRYIQHAHRVRLSIGRRRSGGGSGRRGSIEPRRTVRGWFGCRHRGRRFVQPDGNQLSLRGQRIKRDRGRSQRLSGRLPRPDRAGDCGRRYWFSSRGQRFGQRQLGRAVLAAPARRVLCHVTVPRRLRLRASAPHPFGLSRSSVIAYAKSPGQDKRRIKGGQRTGDALGVRGDASSEPGEAKKRRS
jgi:hypothetical protein